MSDQPVPPCYLVYAGMYGRAEGETATYDFWHSYGYDRAAALLAVEAWQQTGKDFVGLTCAYPYILKEGAWL